jgi:hypothetical protein
MRALEPFEPRLIGSVSTGHIRKGSDIDLHVFTDDPDALLVHVKGLGWVYETERVTILKFGEIREYMHVHVKDRYDVELTVYDRRELRFRPRSSTDGRPIVRVKPAALELLLASEHTEPWRAYLAGGVIAGLGESDEEADGDGVHDLSSWDGLLTDEEPDVTERLPTEDELAAETEPYDPLPGFEAL